DVHGLRAQLVSALMLGIGSLHWTILGTTAVVIGYGLMLRFAVPLLALFGVGLPAAVFAAICSRILRHLEPSSAEEPHPTPRPLRRHARPHPPRPRTRLGRGAPPPPAPPGALRDAHRCPLAPPVVGLRPGATRHERNPGMITRRNLLQAAPVATAGALALSACGGGSGGEGGSGGSLSWMALLHTPTTPDASGPVHSGLAEETGQQFEIQWVPDASKEEKMNAALASGSVADITSITNLTNSSIRSGVTSGLFWD